MMKAVSGCVGLGAVLILFAACPSPGTGTTLPPQADIQSPTLGPLMIVPPGRFQRDANSANVSVITESFLMACHEVTRSQFQSVMGNDPVLMLSATSNSTGAGDPVMKVNWYHAIAFCNRLSLREGLEPVYAVVVDGAPVDWEELSYPGVPINLNPAWDAAVADWTANGYRLPTEMEWMWAAMGAPTDGRGETPNTTGYLKAYAGSREGGGTDFRDQYAWFYGNSGGKTHPAGSREGNELGLYDMSGNVFELCWDWWDFAWPEGSLEDYRGPGFPSDNTMFVRVAKGGAWSSYGDQDSLTIAASTNPWPYYRNTEIGFRVVRRYP